MLYAIPDWYNDIRELKEDSLKNLIDLFVMEKRSVQLLILNFNPSLRYILHVNSLTSVNYWSIWDHILGIKRKEGIPLAPEELDLPAGTELLYSINKITAYVGDDFYAEILVNNEGYVNEVEVPNEHGIRIDVYDDRGFKAQSKYYVNKSIEKIEWFNEYGEVVVQSGAGTSKVKVLSEQDRFSKIEYESMNELLLEFIEKMIKQKLNVKQDVIVTDSENSFAPLIQRVEEHMPINYILKSGNRLDEKVIDNAVQHVANGNQIFVDNQYIYDQLASESIDLKYLHIGYPYGTDMRLGNSNEEKILNIYWELRTQNDTEKIKRTMVELTNYVVNREDAAILIESDSYRSSELVQNIFFDQLVKRYKFIEEKDRATVTQIISNQDKQNLIQNFIWRLQKKVDEMVKNNNELLNAKLEIPNFSEIVRLLGAVQVNTKSKNYQILSVLDIVRIIIDIGEPYDTLTQFNGISAGIPQINMIGSPLVIDKWNGWIVNGGRTITDGLNYFLNDLRHWNQSLVGSVQLMEQYSVERQVDWWEEKLYGKN